MHRSVLMDRATVNIDQNLHGRQRIVDENEDYLNGSCPHLNRVQDYHVGIAAIVVFHVRCLACERASGPMGAVAEPENGVGSN